MRMNRGTIVLIAALLVIIVVVIVVENQQASAPGETPTPEIASGALLPGVSGENIVRYEVRDNTSGDFVALTKDSGGAWHIDATNALAGRDPEQSLINTTVGQIATINYNNTFQDDQLATFGVDHPAYTILVLTSDNILHTIYVGSKSPTSARYYAVVQSAASPEATAEATSETNVLSIQPSVATAEATAEATSNSAPKRIFQSATEEATAEATAEMTAGAPVEATAEATSEATAEVTEMPTANVVQNPGVTLEGQQTIYLIPQTVIDTLKNWLTTPPYAPLPTAAPTSAAATVAPPPLLEATLEASPEMTSAATAEATAAP